MKFASLQRIKVISMQPSEFTFPAVSVCSPFCLADAATRIIFAGQFFTFEFKRKLSRNY